MSPVIELDCHPASPEERIEAFRNVFSCWPHADTLDEHIARRLASPQHSRAQWFVGCLDGKVVVSLGSYPMKYRVRSELLAGIAIGAVHTVPEYRRRGLAARLLGWVERRAAGEGARLSLLFSDIPPDYYARLGYTLCPALEGWRTAKEDRLAPPPPLKLVEIDTERNLHLLRDLYTSGHRHWAIAIDRDEDYWRYLIRKWPMNRFYGAVDSSGEIQGYVALNPNRGRLKITDYSLPAELYGEMVSAVRVKALAEGYTEIGGWLPDLPAFRDCFPLRPRSMEITMLKFLDSTEADPEIQQHAGCLCEIDHV